jgi:hypothetical protein
MFDQEVNTTATAFGLTNMNTATPVTTMQTSSSVIDGKTMVTMTFDPGASILTRAGGNSLDEGEYMLEVFAAEVTQPGGDPMTSDFVFGNAVGDNFYRMYGDANGTGSLDLLDFSAFRVTFGQSMGSPNYNDSFDANGDGVVGLPDFSAFRMAW